MTNENNTYTENTAQVGNVESTTTNTSSESKPSKGRQPDYDMAQQVRMGKNQRLVDIGAMWESDSGYISGDTVHGRIVLKPRNKKEALEEIRNETAKSPEQDSPAPEVSI
jgi:hypothetical protein